MRTHYPQLVEVHYAHIGDSACHAPDIPFSIMPPASAEAGLAFGQYWATNNATPEQLKWFRQLDTHGDHNRYHSGHKEWNACVAAELTNDASLLRARPSALDGIWKGIRGIAITRAIQEAAAKATNK